MNQQLEIKFIWSWWHNCCLIFFAKQFALSERSWPSDYSSMLSLWFVFSDLIAKEDTSPPSSVKFCTFQSFLFRSLFKNSQSNVFLNWSASHLFQKVRLGNFIKIDWDSVWSLGTFGFEMLFLSFIFCIRTCSNLYSS